MPHVSGHNAGGLMTNPYQQAAESMQQAGLSGVGDVGVKERKKTSEKNPSYVPPQPGGTITETQPSGPVGSNGNGKWNAGFDDDEESKSWDSIQNNPDRNRILNEVVEKYNDSWLGAHNEWGNFEDDLPITQAAKWGSNFLLRMTALPFELTTAKFVGDPAANIYEGLQEAGYIDATGTKKTISDKGILFNLPISGMEYEQPSPFEFGMGVKTATELGIGAYSIPSIVRSIPGGFNAVKNIFNKNVNIKSADILKIDNAFTKDEQISIVQNWNKNNPDNRVIDFVDLQAVSAVAKSNSKYVYHQYPNIKIGKETDNFGLITNKNVFVKDVETELARIITSGTDEGNFLKNIANNLDESLVTTQMVFDGKKYTTIKIPKIFYHGTSKNFMKFDVKAPKTHSDVGGFNGVTDDISTAQYYAMHKGGPLKDSKGDPLPPGTKAEEELLVKEQLWETPKIFTGVLNVKKIWKLSDENDIELMAHVAASKKWSPDTSPSSIAVLKESAKWKLNADKKVDLLYDDFVKNPTYNQRYDANLEHLKNNSSPWALIEDNISYLNKNYKYDAFQTKEAGKVNYMLTDPDNQLVPIHNALRDKNIQTKEWGNGFETKVNWVEDLSQWDIPVTKAITEHRGSFAIEMVM